MSDSNSKSWDDGSNYEPDRGPAEPTVPLPSDFGQQPQSGAQSQVPPPPPMPGGGYPTPPMPGGGYPPPGAGVYPPARTTDGGSVGALVTGILSLVFLLLCAFLSAPLGIVAIILGVQGRQRARSAGRSSGQATAGIVLGVLSLVLTVVWIVVMAAISAGS